MSVTLTLGWWIVPLLVSLALVVWALWDRPSERGGFFPDLGGLFRLAGAIIVSLVLWIVYLLVLLALG